jgi:hypothetical protein
VQFEVVLVSFLASVGNLSVSFKVPILIANSTAKICLHFLCLVELSLQEHHDHWNHKFDMERNNKLKEREEREESHNLP